MRRTGHCVHHNHPLRLVPYYIVVLDLSVYVPKREACHRLINSNLEAVLLSSVSNISAQARHKLSYLRYAAQNGSVRRVSHSPVSAKAATPDAIDSV